MGSLKSGEEESSPTHRMNNSKRKATRWRDIGYTPLPSQARFHRLRTRFKGFSGPVGSGKSAALCQEAIRRAYQNPGRQGLLGAPTYAMLRDATQHALVEMLERNELPYELNRSQNYVVIEECRSKILFRSMEEYERLRGTNLAWFGLDELTYTAEEAWLRWKRGYVIPWLRHCAASQCGYRMVMNGVWPTQRLVTKGDENGDSRRAAGDGDRVRSGRSCATSSAVRRADAIRIPCTGPTFASPPAELTVTNVYGTSDITKRNLTLSADLVAPNALGWPTHHSVRRSVGHWVEYRADFICRAAPSHSRHYSGGGRRARRRRNCRARVTRRRAVRRGHDCRRHDPVRPYERFRSTAARIGRATHGRYHERSVVRCRHAGAGSHGNSQPLKML